MGARLASNAYPEITMSECTNLDIARLIHSRSGEYRNADIGVASSGNESPPPPTPLRGQYLLILQASKMDSYRPPKSRQNIYSMPPPPAPPDMPPFSVRKEFSFRNQDSAPQYPQGGDRYRPQSSLREDNLPRRKKKHQGGRARREAREAAANRRFWGPRIATAERPLLTARGDHNPEHIGFDTRRFMPADDLSDSDEEDMEESDIDDGLQWNDGATDNPTQNGHMDDLSSLKVDDDTIEPPTKRRALVSVAKVNEEPDIPKWSNPDPYTVLPPVDESQRKRKDVVKIIRKARISTDKAMGAESQVVTNDDFISLGFDKGTSSNDLNHSSSPSDFESGKDEPGVPGAPTGPRSFRHLTNLYGRNDSCAPGASTPALSVGTLGPPPGLSNGYDATSKQRLARSDSYPDQMAALGSRKRTHDDQIKDDNGQKPKPKPLRQASNGSLLHEWVPRGVNEATPWLRDDHRSTKDPGHRLHKEVCDFYDFVRPQDFEQVVREALLQRLQAAVSEEYPGYNVYCFGSFAAGMYLPNADMDLVIISQSFRKMGERVAFQYQHQMRTFGNFLERSELAEQGSLQVIFSAKVPLVKYVDRLTGILVDVSFENNTGLIANDTFNAWKLQFPAMPILATLIKQFLLMRGLNEVVSGGLGGFSVTCLVTSLLQNLPRVQAGEVIPEQHLGEMLLEFFDLYGNSFDITRTGISMNPPGYYNKVPSTAPPIET